MTLSVLRIVYDGVFTTFLGVLITVVAADVVMVPLTVAFVTVALVMVTVGTFSEVAVKTPKVAELGVIEDVPTLTALDNVAVVPEKVGAVAVPVDERDPTLVVPNVAEDGEIDDVPTPTEPLNVAEVPLNRGVVNDVVVTAPSPAAEPMMLDVPTLNEPESTADVPVKTAAVTVLVAVNKPHVIPLLPLLIAPREVRLETVNAPIVADAGKMEDVPTCKAAAVRDPLRVASVAVIKGVVSDDAAVMFVELKVPIVPEVDVRLVYVALFACIEPVELSELHVTEPWINALPDVSCPVPTFREPPFKAPEPALTAPFEVFKLVTVAAPPANVPNPTLSEPPTILPAVVNEPTVAGDVPLLIAPLESAPHETEFVPALNGPELLIAPHVTVLVPALIAPLDRLPQES